MPRISGVDLPKDKKILYSLRYIYGVGHTSSRDICSKAGIAEDTPAKDLTEGEVATIAGVIDRDYVVEGQLRRQVQQNIARLRDIGCYRGLRHRRGLPTRGQHTRTNARTRKGPKKTVAGKKGVKEMQRG